MEEINNKTSYIIIYISIFTSIFSMNIIEGYNIFVLSTLFVFIQLIMNSNIKNLFPQNDKIFNGIILIVLIIILSYIFNLNYTDYVEQTYSKVSGENPKNLYLKIFGKGLIYSLVIIIAYLTGRKYFGNSKTMGNLFKLLFIFFSINAFADVFVWLTETNGLIARYNFTPPITGTAGTSIHFSSIGFILGLPVLKKENNNFLRNLYRIFLIILFLGVLIIITRKSQILFLFMIILYFIFFMRSKIKLFYFLLLLSLYYFNFTILQSLESFSSYSKMFTKGGDDIEMRLAMLNSSFELFLKEPILGIGYGMFSGHNLTPVYNNANLEYLGSPHNGIAAILCELGIIGLIAYINLNVRIIKKLYFSLKSIKKINQNYLLLSALIVILGSSILFSYSNSIFFGPPNEKEYINIAFINFIIIGSSIANSDNKIENK